jgi:hypothetical protein
MLPFTLFLVVLLLNYISYSFRPYPQQVMDTRYVRLFFVENSAVNVIACASNATQIKGKMATSDFKVQIEKREGPDDWPKWKWQILMLLRAHCLEGIIDGSRKCPVLPADAQPQQTKELTEWR